MKYANVSEKFVHPEWNPVTYVANLVLLKLNKRFHFMGEMPDIMNNIMTYVPHKLNFKGLGKIDNNGPMVNSQINTSLEIPNEKSIRSVAVTFEVGLCPANIDGLVCYIFNKYYYYKLYYKHLSSYFSP